MKPKSKIGFIYGVAVCFFVYSIIVYLFFQHEKKHIIVDTIYSTTITLRDSFDMVLKEDLQAAKEEWREQTDLLFEEKKQVAVEKAVNLAVLKEREMNTIKIDQLQQRHEKERQEILEKVKKALDDNDKLATKHEALKLKYEDFRSTLDSFEQKNYALPSNTKFSAITVGSSFPENKPIKVNQSPSKQTSYSSFDSFLWLLGVCVFASFWAVIPLWLFTRKL